MDQKRMDQLLKRLDGSGSRDERDAIAALREGGSALPGLLRTKYHASRSWKTRAACVFYALKHARESDDAVALGREALRDKAGGVRYRACMLLAYSQRREALPDLWEALQAYSGKQGADEVAAAIDAIEQQNHNYFVDRDHSGRVKMSFE